MTASASLTGYAERLLSYHSDVMDTSSRDIESRREEDTSLLPDDWNWPISIKYLWL